MKLEIQDRIDLYVTGRMTEEERLAFEEDMSKDTELKEQTEFTLSVSKSLKRRNDKMERMKGFKKDYEENADKHETPSVHVRNKFKFFYWASSIAAVLVVGFFIMKSRNTTSDGMAFPVELAVENSRGGGEILNKIKQLIENKKCDEALTEIEKQWNEISNEIDKVKKDQTIGRDEKEYTIDSMNSDLESLNYLKAHALLRLGKIDEAKALLDDISNKEGAYKEKAESLYNKIQEP